MLIVVSQFQLSATIKYEIILRKINHQSNIQESYANYKENIYILECKDLETLTNRKFIKRLAGIIQ